MKSRLATFGVGGLLALPWILEFIAYEGVWQAKLGISATAFSLFVLTVAFWQRKRLMFSQWLVFLASLVALKLAIGLGVLESTQYPNYVFSTLHVNYAALTPLSLALLAYAFAVTPSEWLRQHWNNITFSLGLVGVLYGFAYWFIPMGVFFAMNLEGGVVEQLQVVFLVLSLVASAWAAGLAARVQLPPWQKALYVLVFIGMALACLFLAGEEVAWGQHWFGFTADSIQEGNLQGEITLHNHETVAWMIFQAYLLLTTYGSLSWLVPKLGGEQLRAFFPFFTEWYTIPYFLFLLLYLLQQKFFDLGPLVGHWAEYTELFLYIGVFWIAVRNFQRIRQIGKVTNPLY